MSVISKIKTATSRHHSGVKGCTHLRTSPHC